MSAGTSLVRQALEIIERGKGSQRRAPVFRCKAADPRHQSDACLRMLGIACPDCAPAQVLPTSSPRSKRRASVAPPAGGEGKKPPFRKSGRVG